ncbi:MAG: RraA family protein [Acidobacteriota bacterium]|nr:RraA family protein [Acidobacteriota bacterium]
MPNITKALLQILTEFDTPLIANTIGVIDSTPAHEWYMGSSIQSVTPGLGPTVGIAFTCELDSSSPGGTAEMDDYWHLMEEIELEQRPIVWVVKTIGSRPDHECVLGDGMAKGLRAAGCIGVVTNGGVRDIPGLLTVPFAAYAKGKTIHHGNLRFRGARQPVEVGGITVYHGDVIHADGGGVIKIPPSCLQRLPGQAVRMQTFEREAHSLLRRTDLRAAQKRDGVRDLLTKYAFSPGLPAQGNGA